VFLFGGVFVCVHVSMGVCVFLCFCLTGFNLVDLFTLEKVVK